MSNDHCETAEGVEVKDAKTEKPAWVATPGVHFDIPNAEYHADRFAVSSSQLKVLVQQSPAHFLTHLEAGGADTKAKDFGSALHCLLLEPHRFDDEFLVVRPFKRSTKEGRSLAELIEEAADGRKIVSETDYHSMLAMVESATRHSGIRQLLEVGQAETSVVWQDEETGVLLKIRPDWLVADAAIVDVKSAVDASRDGFSRACATYGYAISAAMYRTGVRAVMGNALPFRFIVLEKGRPFAVALYEADSDFLRRGERDFRKALRVLAECRRTGDWPGYQRGETALIGLPAWA